MTEQATVEAPDTDAAASEDAAAPTDPTPETAQGDTEPETFPREVVEKLRAEAAKHRVAAAKHDETKARLHAELVKATGRLADPADLAYNEDHLTDPDKLNADIDALLQSKPHYSSRIPAVGSSIAQGVKGLPPEQKAPGFLTIAQQALGYAR